MRKLTVLILTLLLPLPAWAQAAGPAPPQSCEEQRQWLVVFADASTRARNRQEIESAQAIASLHAEIARLRADLAARKLEAEQPKKPEPEKK